MTRGVKGGVAAPLTDLWRRITVGTSEACWPWQGAKTFGYGVVTLQGERWRAHRLAYTLAKGPIPDGLVIDHLCRNPTCCNPSHLEAVTQRENLLRGRTVNAANAAKTTCPEGHPFDFTDATGKRGCRRCQRAYDRSRRTKTSPSTTTALSPSVQESKEQVA